MKIWIDIANSPHVNFFLDMIQELHVQHEILITSRPLSNTLELLDLHNLSHNVIGRHYGRSIFRKTSGFLIRVLQLYSFLRDKRVDVAISHSSFYSPFVSRMLGVRSIYLNDNEHATGNHVSFLFADTIMVPEFLDLQKVRRQWAEKHKVIVYPGIKEGVYLWSYRAHSTPSYIVENPAGKPVVFIRPEPWTAQYYRGRNNFIDELLLEIKEKHVVIMLPRNQQQKDYYAQSKFSGVRVLENSITIADVMENCSLFIGAGGTMTREAAVIGIPTISIYQDKLLDVDRFLIDGGHMLHHRNPDGKFIEMILQDRARKESDKSLLEKGKAAYELIKTTLLNAA